METGTGEKCAHRFAIEVVVTQKRAATARKWEHWEWHGNRHIYTHLKRGNVRLYRQMQKSNIPEIAIRSLTQPGYFKSSSLNGLKWSFADFSKA